MGTVVEGTVVDVQKFGAFVKIRGGKTGLVHISQISNKFVREISEHVTVGSRIIAKIISVDSKGRVQLSLKNVTPEETAKFQIEEKADTQPAPPVRQEQVVRTRREQPAPAHADRDRRRDHEEDDDFEKKMKRFLRQSEDRLVDLKRNIDAKRGAKKKKNK